MPGRRLKGVKCPSITNPLHLPCIFITLAAPESLPQKTWLKSRPLPVIRAIVFTS